MSPRKTFGGRIREVREKKEMTYSQVARAAGETSLGHALLSPTGVLRIEDNSRANPKLLTLMALARALSVRFTIDPDGVAIEELEDGYADED